jgi:hypothetical protein
MYSKREDRRKTLAGRELGNTRRDRSAMKSMAEIVAGVSFYSNRGERRQICTPRKSEGRAIRVNRPAGVDLKIAGTKPGPGAARWSDDSQLSGTKFGPG